MIQLTKLLLKILNGNIYYDDKVVPVIRRGYPLDKTPCINLDESGGSATLNEDVINKMTLVTSGHPQYEAGTTKYIPMEYLMKKSNATIPINIWCDDETMREDIVMQVITLLNQAKANHYKFCSNFNKLDNTCSFLGTECTGRNKITSKGIKNQCLNPVSYQYENPFMKYDVDMNTFSFDNPFILDDTSSKPVTLRSIIKVSSDYYDYSLIGGVVSENIVLESD